MAGYDIDRKTVLITGASGGFGSELCRKLITEHGCRVIGGGRSREKLEAVASSLGAYRRKFAYCRFDVSDVDAWRRLARRLEEKNVIPDLLINNAGIMPPFEKFAHEDAETARRIIDVDLMSVIYGCGVMMPLLLRSPQGGIINVASSAAFSPVIGAAVYSASKGAVKNFTMALAGEMRGRLFVSAACPGFSMTDLFRDSGLSRTDHEFIDGLGTDKSEIAEQIIRGARSGKEIIICGKDSRLMTAMSSVAPVKANALYAKIMRSSGLDMFKDLR